MGALGIETPSGVPEGIKRSCSSSAEAVNAEPVPPYAYTVLELRESMYDCGLIFQFYVPPAAAAPASWLFDPIEVRPGLGDLLYILGAPPLGTFSPSTARYFMLW